MTSNSYAELLCVLMIDKMFPSLVLLQWGKKKMLKANDVLACCEREKNVLGYNETCIKSAE